MTSKSILKRTLPLIIVLAVIILVAVSCTILSHDKSVPTITSPDGEYLSTTENGVALKVENSKIYSTLKTSYGSTTLLNRVDTTLLKSTSITVDDKTTTAWDEVTATEIQDAIDSAASATDLTGDEYDKAIATYKDTMFKNYGLTTDEELNDYHHLTLAKKVYARAQLEIEIAAADKAAADDSTLDPYFTTTDYENQYATDYTASYWVMVVPFTSATEATNALAQVNVEISSDTVTGADGNKTVYSNVWRYIKDSGTHKAGDILTTAEIIATFISLYNTRYSYLNTDYPTTTEILNNANYTLAADGTYSFNTTVVKDADGAVDSTADANRFYYTDSALSSFNSTARSYVKNTMTTYDATVEAVKTTSATSTDGSGNEITTTTYSTSTLKWYTPSIKSYESGSLQVLMLKLGEIEPDALYTNESDGTYNATVKSALYETLCEADLTTTYIATKMAELRQDANLVIYDETLESSYLTSIADYKLDVKATKKESSTLIASFTSSGATVDYSADDFFKELDKGHGIAAAISELDYVRSLSSSSNTVFDYQAWLSGSKEKACVKDAKKWATYKEEVVTSKENFAAGSYSSYGYSADYGWKNFMRDVYGVNSEFELAIYFLYSDITSDAMTNRGALNDTDTTDDVDTEKDSSSELWAFYNTQMQQIVDDAFTVTGFHFLIEVLDSSGSTTDPSEWTATQVAYAKEFYDEVIAYLQSYSGSYATAMDAIVTAYDASPRFVAALAQDADAQPALENGNYVYPAYEATKKIQIAKYKTAGLSVKYEDLSTFSNGKMVTAFDDAVRTIFKAAVASGDLNETVIYGASTPKTDESHYLTTEYGYHVYVNTACTEVAEWSYTDADSKTVTGILPTLQMVKTYVTDSSSSYLYEVDENGKLKLDDNGDPIETTIKFTTAMSTAVTTYYKVVNTELVGSNYNAIFTYDELLALNVTFDNANYTQESFQRYVKLQRQTSIDALSVLSDLYPAD